MEKGIELTLCYSLEKLYFRPPNKNKFYKYSLYFYCRIHCRRRYCDGLRIAPPQVVASRQHHYHPHHLLYALCVGTFCGREPSDSAKSMALWRSSHHY